MQIAGYICRGSRKEQIFVTFHTRPSPGPSHFCSNNITLPVSSAQTTSPYQSVLDRQHHLTSQFWTDQTHMHIDLIDMNQFLVTPYNYTCSVCVSHTDIQTHIRSISIQHFHIARLLFSIPFTPALPQQTHTSTHGYTQIEYVTHGSTSLLTDQICNLRMSPRTQTRHTH